MTTFIITITVLMTIEALILISVNCIHISHSSHRKARAMTTQDIIMKDCITLASVGFIYTGLGYAFPYAIGIGIVETGFATLIVAFAAAFINFLSTMIRD